MFGFFDISQIVLLQNLKALDLVNYIYCMYGLSEEQIENTIILENKLKDIEVEALQRQLLKCRIVF